MDEEVVEGCKMSAEHKQGLGSRARKAGWSIDLGVRLIFVYPFWRNIFDVERIALRVVAMEDETPYNLDGFIRNMERGYSSKRPITWYPDFDDPATLSCLDAQLAKRFGSPVVILPLDNQWCAWHVVKCENSPTGHRLQPIQTGDDPISARVAALEAAPKRQG